MNISTRYAGHQGERFQVWARKLGGRDFLVCSSGSESGAAEEAEKQARIPNTEAVWLVDTATARKML